MNRWIIPEWSYFRRHEINFSSKSPNPPSLRLFAMRQPFWKRNKEKKMNHSEMQTLSRYENSVEKPKSTPKNEFFIFEAGPRYGLLLYSAIHKMDSHSRNKRQAYVDFPASLYSRDSSPYLSFIWRPVLIKKQHQMLGSMVQTRSNISIFFVLFLVPCKMHSGGRR